jgi:phage terminase large subunit-like protein
MNLYDLTDMTRDEILEKAQTDPEWFRQAIAAVNEAITVDRQNTQLAYYTTANPESIKVHKSRAREVAIVGGNRSSKTDTMLAELSIQMTGHIPLSLQGVYPREKIRAPIRARIVCNSLTDTLEPVIKPKLRYDQWNGMGEPNQGRGHWGWIPQHCLQGGTWESAYSEKYRTLRAAVDSHWVGQDGSVNSMRGWSSCQFLSYDQDLTAFAGSSMHFVGHDELPPNDIYRENRIRTLDVRGQIYTAFTPPDEIGASTKDVSWFFDEVYERGLDGPTRDPSIETIVLHTERNKFLLPEDVRDIASKLTDAQKEVRLYGRFIHLSGVVYSLFCERPNLWCYKCEKKILATATNCPFCGGNDVGDFSHIIEPFIVPSSWPVIFAIDPHPRKPDMMGWFAIAPSDTILQIGELEMEGTADDIKRAVDQWEDAHRIRPVKRLMDPNIATETNDKMRRGWTLRTEYDEAGLRCDLAIDEVNAGISEVQGLLKPDPYLRAPRLQIFNTCKRTIHAFTRWSWDEYSRTSDRELKERPRDRFKDPMDVVRYMAMDHPTYSRYSMAPVRTVTRGARGYYGR